MGRPSTFTDEIFDTICERLENGEVLKAICKDDEMPDRSTVLRWIAAVYALSVVVASRSVP